MSSATTRTWSRAVRLWWTRSCRQDELVNIVASIVKENPVLLDAGHLVVDSLVNAAKAHPVIVKDILARQAQLLEVIVTQHPEVVEQLLTIVSEVLQKQPDVANLLVKALEEGQKLVDEL